MSENRPIDVVLPDSGPLISLAASGHLDLLLHFKPYVRIIVADLVAFEATRYPERFEDARQIESFFGANTERIEIRETVVGQVHINGAKLWDAYQRASSEDRAAMDRVGVMPRRPPRDQGEVAILAVARQIGRESPDDIMLVLAEDQSFLSRGKFAEPHMHILSTRAFIQGLADLKVIEFERVWSDIIAARPRINQELVNRCAPDVEAEWESVIDEGR